MSIQAVAWALEQDLPARPKLVLVSIANHADHTNGYCWLKAETIAAEAACSPRAVFNFVGDLIRNGYVRKAPRKGDDGKQRANDYWIMFGREPLKWTRDRAVVHDQHDDDGDNDGDDAEAAAQDVVEPHAPRASGELSAPEAFASVDKPPGAVGPHAPACIRNESLEPSKTKPEKDAGARSGYVPRSYRPPPPLPDVPQGATLASREANLIFVFEGSRAWKAWVAFKKTTTGISWTLTTSTVVDGQTKRGWRFPTLFPPDQPELRSTGPPTQPESLMNEQDYADMAGEER